MSSRWAVVSQGSWSVKARAWRWACSTSACHLRNPSICRTKAWSLSLARCMGVPFDLGSELLVPIAGRDGLRLLGTVGEDVFGRDLRVVQVERRGFGADARQGDEVVPRRRARGGPLQRTAVAPG